MMGTNVTQELRGVFQNQSVLRPHLTNCRLDVLVEDIITTQQHKIDD